MFKIVIHHSPITKAKKRTLLDAAIAFQNLSMHLALKRSTLRMITKSTLLFKLNKHTKLVSRLTDTNPILR